MNVSLTASEALELLEIVLESDGVDPGTRDALVRKIKAPLLYALAKHDARDNLEKFKTWSLNEKRRIESIDVPQGIARKVKK